MKSLFKKIFGQSEVQQPTADESDSHVRRSPQLLDERFASNFVGNGGRFLYCEDRRRALEYFQRIAVENGWQSFNCPERDLGAWLQTLKLSSQYARAVEANLMYCECMVACQGSIILSSHQTFGKKLTDLPDNYVIIGKVDQLVDSVSDALRYIKAHKSGNIPSGITSITGRGAPQAIGTPTSLLKNVYLLLLEN